MPYAMCPICGAVMHLNVSDPEQWRRERHPHSKPGELVSEPCVYCFAEISVGDHISTRRFATQGVDIERDQSGIVRSIISGDAGSLYVVELESGKSMTLPRAAIRKQKGDG